MENYSFAFIGYRIESLSIKSTKDYPQSEEKYSQKIEVEQILSESNKKYSDVKLNISVTNEKQTLNISISIIGGFSIAEEASEEIFNTLCQVNAPAILFPIARATIISLSSQCGIPGIILPLVNFTQKK